MTTYRVHSFAAPVLVAMTMLACEQPAPAPEPAEPAPAAEPQVSTRTVAPPASTPHWGYEGDTGPSVWGGLSPDFSACAEGSHQSPVDIAAWKSETVPDLRASFSAAALRIVHHEHMADAINNGHTIQVNYTEGDTLDVGDASYELLQYHFHAPSEHTLNGQHFPMEMHMVHKASDGSLAVIGVFIEEGAHNAAFDPVWSNLPREKSVETHFQNVTVNVDDLLPKGHATYRYDGSLTTPPCSEGVKWFVMTEPIQLSPDQIAAFTALIDGNNRPVQPLNDRSIVTDAVDTES
jgi:carbonic anhydrase